MYAWSVGRSLHDRSLRHRSVGRHKRRGVCEGGRVIVSGFGAVNYSRRLEVSLVGETGSKSKWYFALGANILPARKRWNLLGWLDQGGNLS